MSKYKSPNYLFIEWLSQWQSDAAKKNLNSMHTYAKAIRSLQKYPLQFSSGKECIILEHFGPKLCQMLDEQIDKYRIANGPHSFPPPWVKEPTKTKKTKPTKRKSPSVNEVGAVASEAKVSKVLKDYLPQYRSGAYALVMTLQQSIQSGKEYMTKKDLILSAQHMCDSSFTIDAGSRYTAWSSMGNLIKKGYVNKSGSPARYSLTATGVDLAVKMLAQYAIAQPAGAGSSRYIPSVLSDTGEGVATSSSAIVDRNHAPTSSVLTSDIDLNLTREMLDSRKQYSFELSDDEDLLMMEDAEADTRDKTVTIGSSDSEGETNRASDILSNLPKGSRVPVFLSSTESNPSSLSYTSSVSLPAKPTKLPHTTSVTLPTIPAVTKPAVPAVTKPAVPAITKPTVPAVTKPVVPAVTKPAVPAVTKPAVPAVIIPAVPAVTKPAVPAVTKPAVPAVTIPAVPVVKLSSKPICSASVQRPTNVVADDMVSVSGDSEEVSQASTVSSVDVNFSFLPNTFTVLLCVDSCELLGGAHTSTKQQMLMELSRLAVPFEVRKLNLGDFLWIAQEKVASGGCKPRELVLGHIVERKRMDDLAGSICDGQFHEQKFRLKNCGLKSVIYLVEDYGKSQQHFSISEDALNQAIINTQIVDKFFVRRTRDTVDSAAYLALLTQQLQWRHQRKTLRPCTMADITGTRRTAVPADTYPTFDEFNAASCKNRDWCVRDMFAKHLVQLHGLTIDKASAILNVYPTPELLLKAWSTLESDFSRQNMLSLIKCGHMKRNLGAQLSKNIFQLYCQKSLS